MAIKNVTSSDKRKIEMVDTLKVASGGTKVTMLQEDTVTGAFFGHVLTLDSKLDGWGLWRRFFVSLGWWIVRDDGDKVDRVDSRAEALALLRS